MAYCDLTDLLKIMDEVELIQLTDDENAGVVNADRVTQAIEAAQAEIDGYVGSRHAVPLDPVPPIVRAHCADLAVYNLFSRRQGPPEHRAERYKNAVRFLELVSAGKVSLGATDPEGNPPASDAPELSSESPERIFSRSTMRGF